MLSEHITDASPVGSNLGIETKTYKGFSDNTSTTTALAHSCEGASNRHTPDMTANIENCLDKTTTSPIHMPLNIPTFQRSHTNHHLQHNHHNHHRALRRHNTKMRSKMRRPAKCVVCSEKASGMYFGALVCLPCKSFFIRCTKDGKPQLTCLGDKNCSIDRSNRMRCQYCRYKKCLSAGMMRREKPESVEPGEGQELCKVCADIANGIHFGVMTCEGCKKFFRRALKEADTYDCKHQKICTLNPRNRNACRYCRYRKCIAVGMSRQAIRMGRPKKVKTENEAFCENYGRYDCYYAQTAGQVFSPLPPQQIHGQTLSPLAIQQPSSHLNSFSSCSSDDSGIESDTASSPVNMAHSPDVFGTTIKTEPQEFFGSSCRIGTSAYDSKAMDCCHQASRPTMVNKEQEVRNSLSDVEDFFFSDPVELDAEDMNDVLATLGQFLGSMGQQVMINSKGVNPMVNSALAPFEGDYAEKLTSPISQQPHSQTLSNPLAFQGTVNIQNSVQQSYNTDMLPCNRYKHWSATSHCFGEQLAFAQRQGPYPCYSS